MTVGTNSRRRESAAIDAVAHRYSAAWEGGKGRLSGQCLTINGRRIAVEVVVLREKALARYSGATKPRLRFDRVALRLIGDLQAGLRESVPEGRTLVITNTAPIWQASKTVTRLIDELRRRLARRTARLELAEQINGNQVRARLVKDPSGRASKVIGFVHNPDPDHAELLLRLTEMLLRHMGASQGKRAASGTAGERWLVLACGGGFANADTYRQVYSQLAIDTDYRKILLVLSDGRVEPLGG